MNNEVCEKESEVFSELNIIENQTDYIDKLLCKLSGRLDSILHPGPKEINNVVQNPSIPSSTIMGGKLRNIRQNFDNRINYLESIINRIDL